MSKTTISAGTARALLFAVLGIVLFGLHSQYVPLGADYFYTFSPATASWLSGNPVYTSPFFGFFNAPWLLIILIPLQWLTLHGGAAALMLITLAGIISGWRCFSRTFSGYALPISLAICLTNLHTFDLLERGQIDVFVVFSVMLAYVGIRRKNPYLLGASWLMAGVRPTSIFLVLIYTAWLAYKNGYLLRALIVPLVGFLASLVIFDPGWIARWYNMIRFNAPPQPGPWLVTWEHAAASLKLPAAIPILISVLILAATFYVLRRYKLDLHTTFAFLITASLCVIPYALSYHYIVLLIVCVPLLIAWRLWLAFPLFLLTCSPVLRAFLGTDTAWLDIMFPLAIWLLLIWKITLPKAQPVVSRLRLA